MERASQMRSIWEAAGTPMSQPSRRSQVPLGAHGCLDGRGMGFKMSNRLPEARSGIHGQNEDHVFRQDVFASYWKSAMEAEVANSLRVLMIELLGRPESLMLEPTDRFGVWPNCNHDSLDRVEFIVDLQFKYKIDISDEDGARWFTSYTFSEAVRDIVLRLETETESAE